MAKAPDPETLKLVKDWSRPVINFGIVHVPGTDRYYIGDSEFKVSELSLPADKLEVKDLYAHTSYVTTLALAGKFLVSGGYDGQLIWWDTEAKKQLRSVEAHSKWIRQVIAIPDQKQIVSVADDMVARVWDAATGKLVHELRGHEERTPHHFPSMLYAVTCSADGKYIATGDKVGHVVVWDRSTGKQVSTLESPIMYTWDPRARLHSIGGIRSLAFSPDGKQLAVGGMGKVGNIDHLEGKSRVEVFDWKSGKPIAEFQSDKFKGLVNRLAYAPDGSWLVGAGGANEGLIIFYDVANQKILREEKAPMHVHDMYVSPAFDQVTLAGHNKIALYAMG